MDFAFGPLRRRTGHPPNTTLPAVTRGCPMGSTAPIRICASLQAGQNSQMVAPNTGLGPPSRVLLVYFTRVPLLKRPQAGEYPPRMLSLPHGPAPPPGIPKRSAPGFHPTPAYWVASPRRRTAASQDLLVAGPCWVRARGGGLACIRQPGPERPVGASRAVPRPIFWLEWIPLCTIFRLLPAGVAARLHRHKTLGWGERGTTPPLPLHVPLPG